MFKRIGSKSNVRGLPEKNNNKSPRASASAAVDRESDSRDNREGREATGDSPPMLSDSNVYSQSGSHSSVMNMKQSFKYNQQDLVSGGEAVSQVCTLYYQ